MCCLDSIFSRENKIVDLGAFFCWLLVYLTKTLLSFPEVQMLLCSSFFQFGKGKQLFHKPVWSVMKDLAIEAKAVIKILSFQIIVAQGITGSFPWSALSFAPMWLELMGFYTHRNWNSIDHICIYKFFGRSSLRVLAENRKMY
ncbi:hypothetical protein SEVIR_9G258100v4 [Setaria viridis]|uniref:Uncharacterized protein n=2 Tax=Setaria TaxID=4554 RepID=A0A368SKM4_SETIT|nr:hypothetical protein SETIT_9G255800v2 [Setaria italica]TKV93875.1 hypothetical protein SEVIR_9G258100v2 [Setaria viridis]